jgi:hypothetical protein
MKDNDFAYIGVKDGSVRAIVFDDAGYEKDTAKLVAEWITMGRTVERLPRAEALKRTRATRAALSAARQPEVKP